MRYNIFEFNFLKDIGNLYRWAKHQKYKLHFKILIIVITVSWNNLLLAQSTFPINGNRDPNHNYIAFINANITTQPGELISNAKLLIKNGKIEAVGKEVVIPKSAVIYDLRGAYIYHSFIEPYSDYGIDLTNEKSRGRSVQMESQKKGAYDWNEAIKSELKADELFVIDKEKAKTLRKNGYGLVVTQNMDGIFRGTSTLVSLMDESENKAIKEAEVFTAYSFDKGSSKQSYPTSLMGIIALMRQTFYDAKWYAELDRKKEYNISLERINSFKDLPKMIAVQDYLSVARANKIADEFGFKFIIKGGGDEYKNVNELLSSKSAFILPLNFPKAFDIENPYDALNISLSDLKHWELAPFNASILAQNNINFAFSSTDLEKAKEFLSQLQKTIAAGLSKETALAALTTQVAQILQLDYTDGRLKKGNPANFIICSSEIFDNKSVIYENWVEGEQYVIHNRNSIDLRGTYSLNINTDLQYDLIVEGEVNQLTAKLKQADSSIKCNIDLKGNQITLSFISQNEDYKGLMRLSGHISDEKSRIWSGNATASSGEWLKWVAIKKEEFKQKVKKDSLQILSRGEIWYPNMAYGFTEKPTAKNFLIRNATIWTNTEKGILQEADVLIQNGKIAKIGTKIDLDIIFPKKRPEIEEFDAKGMHLTAGIVDEHSHIAISRGVNESGQSNTAEVSIAEVVDPDDINIYRQLSGGVVASQLLHGSANPIGGKSAIIKLKWGASAEEMKIDSADGFIKFALGENVKQSNWGEKFTIRFPQTRMGVEQQLYDDFYRAKEYQDIWKIYNAGNKKEKRLAAAPRKDLELETLSEILNDKRFITCHSYIQSEINMLMHVADSMDFRINTFTHILEGYKVADKLKAHDAAASTFSDWWAYKFEVKDAIPYNGAILHKMGVNTAFNSDDAEMGRRLNQEAAKAIKYGGLSEQEAFKFVTLNPAKMLHLDNKMGSIEVGKDADVVLWTANPLSVYAKVRKTIIEGVCYYDSERDIDLRKAAMAERERLINKMIEVKNEGGKTQKIKVKGKQNYECDTYEDEGHIGF